MNAPVFDGAGAPSAMAAHGNHCCIVVLPVDAGEAQTFDGQTVACTHEGRAVYARLAGRSNMGRDGILAEWDVLDIRLGGRIGGIRRHYSASRVREARSHHG